jgi:ribosomal protein S18 acetylase RimI-like enzyme
MLNEEEGSQRDAQGDHRCHRAVYALVCFKETQVIEKLPPTRASSGRPPADAADVPTVRPFTADEWRVYRDLRLRALTDSPDAFGSTLAAEEGRPDAEWARRLAAAADTRSNLPLVAEVRGAPIGLAWGRIEPSAPDAAALYQMWVAPSHRGSGAGRMLLEAVIVWARARNAAHLDLGVTCGDSPARHLYERAGFRSMGEPQPLRPGSPLWAQPMRFTLRTVEPGLGCHFRQ